MRYTRSAGKAAVRRACLIAAVTLLAILPPPARGQDGFRVTFQVDQGTPDRVRLVGMVTNGRPDDVVDVHVTAEALDARGRVVASGITYVEGRLNRGDSRPFVAVVPMVTGMSRYRASVTSFRSLGLQAP
jgi:hypothetical protein